MKKMMALPCAALALAAAAARADELTTGDFEWRMMIVFGGCTENVPLTNFPALVRLPCDATREMKEDGADLRFAGVDGGFLPHEIEAWDTNGVSMVWVGIPELEPNAVIFAYWGNGDAEAPDNGAEVWKEYAGVWHFTQAEGDLSNSTTNNLDGTRVNTIAAPGVAGAAQYFDGSSGLVRVPHDDAMNLGAHFTVSGWFKYPDPTPGNAWRRLFNKKNGYAADNGWEVEKLDGAHNVLRPRGNNGNNRDITMPNGWTFNTPLPRAWHHLTFQYTGANSGAVYVNGVLAGATDFGGGVASDNDWDFFIGGSVAGGGECWSGYIDEVRLEPGNRPVAWIKACHDTMANPVFAVCGAIAGNTPFEDVMALGALNVTHESADIQGLLSTMDTVPVYVVPQIAEDGVSPLWVAASAPVALDSTGVFTVPVANLGADTPYLARLVITDWHGNIAFEGAAVAAFQTAPLPSPILGGVHFDFIPGAAKASVSVGQLGVNSELVFMLDNSGGAWAHVATNSAPSASAANEFPLGALTHGAAYNWRAVLTSAAGGEDELSGSFTVAYSFTWVGGNAGDRLWDNPLNWNPNGIPNNPGDSVTFNTDAYNWDDWNPFVHLETPVTIGSATFNVPPNVTRHYNVTGAPLTFDNAIPAPCEITSVCETGRASMNLLLPVTFNKETSLRTHAASEHWWFAIGGDMDGPGPLVIEQGRLALSPSADTTQACRVPILGADDSTRLLKRGAGDSIMTETPQSLILGATSRDYWGSLIADGGRLVIDNCAVTNTHPNMQGALFNQGGGTLLVTNNATYYHTTRKDDRAYHFTGEGGGGNALIVNGAYARMPLLAMNAPGNTINVQEGGLLEFMGDYPWRAIDFNSSANTLRAGSGNPARPAVIELNGQPLRLGTKVYDWTDYHLNNNLVSIQSGGILQNGRIDIAYSAYNDGYFTNNVLEILDGGVVRGTGDNLIGYTGILGWYVREGEIYYYYGYCNGNHVLVASSTGAPSMWDLNNGNLQIGWQLGDAREDFNTTNNALRVGFGGVVTNANLVAVGNENALGNKLSLEGGALYCNTLAITAGNILAPVLGANGILPARANTATLEPGAKVVPANFDGATGVYPLITANNLGLPDPANPNTLLHGAPTQYAWKLGVAEDAETGVKTLWLACQKPGALLLVK